MLQVIRHTAKSVDLGGRISDIELNNPGHILRGLILKISGTTTATSGTVAQDAPYSLLGKIYLRQDVIRPVNIFGGVSGQFLKHISDTLHHITTSPENPVDAGGGTFEATIYLPIAIPAISDRFGYDVIPPVSTLYLSVDFNGIASLYTAGSSLTLSNGLLQPIGLWENNIPTPKPGVYSVFEPVENPVSPLQIQPDKRVKRVWLLVRDNTGARADNLTSLSLNQPIGTPLQEFGSSTEIKRLIQNHYGVNITGLYVIDTNISRIAQQAYQAGATLYVKWTTANTSDTVSIAVESEETL
jgi:hypothetical protein